MVRYRDIQAKGDVHSVNVAGLAFYDVEEISVNEYHSLPNGEGEPEQVHMMLKLERVEHPIVIRFKSPATLDQVIVALMAHRRRVWPREEQR